VHSLPQPPSARLGAPIARDLEAIILACLAKRPEDRPPSATALREQLRSCAAAAGWTNERAAQWWADHRAGIRNRAGKLQPPEGALEPGRLTIARLAD
jgi:serine/threonine-protein kinase